LHFLTRTSICGIQRPIGLVTLVMVLRLRSITVVHPKAKSGL